MTNLKFDKETTAVLVIQRFHLRGRQTVESPEGGGRGKQLCCEYAASPQAAAEKAKINLDFTRLRN